MPPLTLDEHIDSVFRDYFSEGIPASDRVDVSIPDVRSLLHRMSEIEAASSQTFTRWDSTQRITMRNFSLTTRALTVNTIYQMPIMIGAPGIALRIGVEVTTEIAGSAARLGIYQNLYGKATPSVLMLDAGTVSTETTGFKEIVISQEMTPGLYWLALVTNGAITVRSIANTMPYSMMNGLANARALSPSRTFTYGALPVDESAASYTWSITGPIHLWVGG